MAFYFIPLPQPPVVTSGGGGGGFTIAYRDKEIPKVLIKKVVLDDEFDRINITVLRVIDLSISGGN